MAVPVTVALLVAGCLTFPAATKATVSGDTADLSKLFAEAKAEAEFATSAPAASPLEAATKVDAVPKAMRMSAASRNGKLRAGFSITPMTRNSGAISSNPIGK